MDVGLPTCVLVDGAFDESGDGCDGLLKEVGCEKMAHVDPMVDMRRSRPATEVNGAGLGFSKRLPQEREPKEVARANSERLRGDGKTLEDGADNGMCGSKLRSDVVTVF